MHVVSSALPAHPKNIQQLRVGGSCPSPLRRTESCLTPTNYHFEQDLPRQVVDGYSRICKERCRKYTAFESFDEEDRLSDVDVENRPEFLLS
jgi:hypothetical protein